MTVVITGRRVRPSDDLGDDGFPWGMQQYDYGQAEDGVWWCYPPQSEVAPLRVHTVAEHADGTISVQPSISTPQFHGYLDEGHWCGSLSRADSSAGQEGGE